MKLIKPSFSILPQSDGLEGIYRQIEMAGRTCYKSEDKITETSAKEFVDRMIKSGHGAMLEHGTVYLMVHTIAPEDWDKKIARHPLSTIDDSREHLRTNPTCNSKGEENWWAKEAGHIAHKMAVKYADNPYSKVKIVTTKHEVNTEGGIIITPTDKMPIVTRGSGKITSVFNTILITTNLRVLVENNWLDDLKYVCEPTEHHERRYTVKFICDRGVSHEFVRHRVFSFAQESTRYCNYSKDKFGNEVTFIIPEWFDLKEGHCVYKDALVENGTLKEQGGFYIDDLYIGNEWGGEIWAFLWTLQHCEHYYFGLINKGWKPQQARAILPNSLKTELVMTGFISDWKHFFELRTAGSAHPQARELAIPLREEFINKGYI